MGFFAKLFSRKEEAPPAVMPETPTAVETQSPGHQV